MGNGTSVDLAGDGLSTFGMIAGVTAGLIPRVDGQLFVPWYRSRVLNEGDPDCALRGLQACKTSTGLGTINLRIRGQLLDELYGAPVSLTLGGELRQGQLTADTRARLTAIGEGTADAGGFLAMGRSGGFGEGVWSASTEVGWRYRFKNTTTGAPGNEVFGDVELLAGPTPSWKVGLVGIGLLRPNGLDLGETDFTDPERFVALRVRSVQVGGKLLLRNDRSWTVVLSGLRTVYAQNVPSDELIISAGISMWQPAPAAEL
ncbi:MAG: hypothetical protein ACI8RZ_001117 [Myxococcota bacterium]|jgi:hypothetical protein